MPKAGAVYPSLEGDIKGRQACEGAPWVIKAVDLAAFDKAEGAARPVTPNCKQQAFDFQ